MPSGPANGQHADDSTPEATRARPYRRILLKLSGEALGGTGAQGLDPEEMRSIALEIREAQSVGAQIAVVVGGGNFVRGATMARIGKIHQATADYMGMLATIINGLALKEALLAVGVDSRVMSAIEVKAVAEPFIRGRALRHMEKGRVLILVAGTGNPFCTTDTCAALRAAELDCQVILKATKVDGVYTADPKTNPQARRYASLTYMDAITQNLKVMDMTAFTMCQERSLPIIVFDFRTPGNIKRVALGQRIGTIVENGTESVTAPREHAPA
jgi:uridylate kinase